MFQGILTFFRGTHFELYVEEHSKQPRTRLVFRRAKSCSTSPPVTEFTDLNQVNEAALLLKRAVRFLEYLKAAKHLEQLEIETWEQAYDAFLNN